jgi:integrase
MFNNFNAQRKRSAKKLGNPRLLKIHFHTLRHWKATMEYHRTKDILYVMKLLGHKSRNNTLVYTQLMEFEGDEYHSAIANGVEEAKKLVEAGFEYVCNHENVMLFRKRK